MIPAMPTKPTKFTSRHPGDFLTPEQFWARVQIGAPSECWPWTGTMFAPDESHPVPYGRVAVRKGDTTFATGAHRVAFEFHYGWRPGTCRHSCDNPPCCNPAHLLDGTQADNMRDRSERKRVRNGREKLTPEQVREVRARYQRGLGGALAREYGVSTQTIHRTVRGETNAHI